MTKLQFDLSEKANKNLERYMVYNEIGSKADAANRILECLDLSDDKSNWLDKERLE